MKRLILLSSAAFLTACTQPQMEEPMMEPEVVLEEVGFDCIPGDDDGIGGTGCPESVEPDLMARHKPLEDLISFR